MSTTFENIEPSYNHILKYRFMYMLS